MTCASGDPARELLSEAAEHQADLIVRGSRRLVASAMFQLDVESHPKLLEIEGLPYEVQSKCSGDPLCVYRGKSSLRLYGRSPLSADRALARYQ